MNDAMVAKAAGLLADARRGHRPLDALPDDCRPQNEDDAYRIQDALLSAIGDGLLGWKVGCTNRTAQEIFGVDAPIAGRVLESLAYKSPAVLPASGFFMLAVECEVAFHLERDLPASGGPYSRDDVARAADTAHPAIEIADSRFRDFRGVGGMSVIADNSNFGAFIYGPGIKGWRSMALETHACSLIVNGGRVARGTGAEVMGDPVDSLHWLVNHATARGRDLGRGELVTTGTWTGVHFASPGDSIRADFGELGRIELRLEHDAE